MALAAKAAGQFVVVSAWNSTTFATRAVVLALAVLGLLLCAGAPRDDSGTHGGVARRVSLGNLLVKSATAIIDAIPPMLFDFGYAQAIANSARSADGPNSLAFLHIPPGRQMQEHSAMKIRVYCTR